MWWLIISITSFIVAFIFQILLLGDRITKHGNSRYERFVKKQTDLFKNGYYIRLENSEPNIPYRQYWCIILVQNSGFSYIDEENKAYYITYDEMWKKYINNTHSKVILTDEYDKIIKILE